MIERHVTFNVQPEATGAFERFIATEYGPAMATSGGFVRLELLREIESPTRYQMSFRFDDAESAVGWRTSEVHLALQPALTALSAIAEIQGYEVIG